MKHPFRVRSISAGARLTLLLSASLVVLGCAQAPLDQGGSEIVPVTESDEPETRKRARIRLELASNYFEQGQTNVALDEIKQSIAADPTYTKAYVLRGLVFIDRKSVV